MLSALPPILKKYKAAWETHDLQLLELLFTPDVIYQEKPEIIYHGITELKAYWLENKGKQKNVVFCVQRFVQAENQLVVDWEAEFWHLVKEKIIRVSGIMWLSLQNDKIANLKEYFVISD